MRSTPLPTGPASLAQSQHLRRESSQSQHSDFGGPMNRNFVPGNGRGRGGYNQAYPNPSHSPSAYRSSPVPQPRHPAHPANVQSFQPGGMRGMPNNAYGNSRSPAQAPVAMHQPHMNGQQPMHQYGPQQYLPVINPVSFRDISSVAPSSFIPSSVPIAKGASTLLGHNGDVKSRRPLPHVSAFKDYKVHAQVERVSPKFSISSLASEIIAVSGGFDRYLTTLKAQAMYGAPPQDYYYYNQPYMQPGMPGMPYPPASPRAYNATQAHHPGGFIPGPYMQPSNMSRTPSAQGSERPSSTAPPQASTPLNTNQPPPVVSSSPAPHSRPERPKTKGIVIKNPDGEIIDIKAQLSSNSPAPTQSRAPAVVSSGAGIPSISTPPPRSATETPQSVPEVTTTAEERKRQFTEQFKKNLQIEKGEGDDKSVDEEKTKIAAPEVKPVEPVVETKVEPVKDEVSKAADPVEIEEEDDEAWIREIEEQERAEEERMAKYEAEKKAKLAAAAAAAAAKEDEDLKRAEREAEELEEAKLKGKGDEESAEAKAEREKLFGALKKSSLGPAATQSEVSTPASESMPPPPTPSSTATTPTSKGPVLSRTKPSSLKIETGKSVEPAQPTAGMQSLRSARFIKLQKEDNIYPEGIQSPNPALNDGGKSRGRQYDKDFLLQFQEVFKEKPSIEWDKILKDTVGDSSDSARPSSARTPSMGGRQNSRNAGPAMGQFAAGASRTLAPGSTSEQRFAASSGATRMGGSAPINPLAQFAHVGRGGIGSFAMGNATPMSRTGSAQSRGPHNVNAPRTNSGRNNSSRRVGGPQEAQMAKTMPLTAGKDLKPLQVSQSGWKPISIGTAPVAVPTGNLTPDVVQRKVKAALNKMTPEKFEKISEDILMIAAQSREESDGRTLRQVIQLTFEKACDEAHWASMYARFCKRMLETMSHDIKDENVKDKTGNPVVGGALFRKYLLNRCQEEFERGWELNLPEKKEGESEEAAMLSEEYYKAAAAKRRGLGLIQFIGELYKLGMLTMRIMHECLIKLLNFTGIPEESTVESLVKLLRTIGSTMDSAQPNGRDMVNVYFDRVQTLMNTPDIPSRMYYMLLDIVDLRRKGWETKDTDKGPKTITEIHEEAARKAAAADMERQRSQRQGGRPQAGRGDARSFSGQPPQDYARNQVGMDDLRRLAGGGRRAGQSSGQSLGPAGGLMSSRNNSRRGLGPPSDGPSSRTGTPPVEKKDSAISANAFR
jgi:translation initiation factor 4G